MSGAQLANDRSPTIDYIFIWNLEDYSVNMGLMQIN